MRTYKYVLFLKHPTTNHCINQWIEVDTDEGDEFLSIHSLMEKLHRSGDKFQQGYTLIGMNIAQAKVEEK